MEKQYFPYFTTYDAHRQFLPVVTAGLKGFFSTGIAPVWDAYSGLGMQVFLGGYAFYYPPLHLAYAIAALAGAPYLTIEFYSFAHLLAAYGVFYFAARRLQASPLLAACAAASYAMSGYFLIGGRSYAHVCTAAFFMAVLIYLLTHVVNGERLGKRWAGGLALAIAGFYYADHQQLWFYGILSFLIALGWALIAQGRTAPRNALMCMAGGLAGMALIAPLLVVQWLEMQYTAPFTPSPEEGIARQLLSLLLPIDGSRSFAGGVYAAASVLLMAVTLGSLFRRSLLPAGAFAFSALICLLFAVGDMGPLWPWAKQLPIFNHFRYLDKWVIFITTFTAAGGTWMLARLAARSSAARHAVHVVALTGLTGSMYYVTLCVSPRAFDIPMPQLPQSLAGLHAQHYYRLVSLGPLYKHQNHFVMRLNNNYPSYYAIFSANRYNQRITTTPERFALYDLSQHDPAAFLARYAVGWALSVPLDDGEYDIGSDLFMRKLYDEANAQTLKARPIPESENLTLHELDTAQTDPLVGLYREDAPPAPLPFSVRPDGLLINLPHGREEDAEIIAAFLTHRWFRAYALPEGNALALRADDYNRMQVTVPASAQSLLLVLEPPWHYGMMLGAGLLLLAFGAGYAATSKDSIA